MDEQLTSKAVVSVVRRGETTPQFASAFILWISKLCDWTKPVEIGDTVIEVTHIIGTARKGVGLHSAIGTLLRIEPNEGHGETYVIRDVEGIEQRWTNAKLCLVAKDLRK